MKNKVTHKFRLEHLDKAKEILKTRVVSSYFFDNLSLALPENFDLLSKVCATSAENISFHDALKMLEDVAGIVISKGYKNVPNILGQWDNDKSWEWYRKCKEAGKTFVVDVIE